MKQATIITIIIFLLLMFPACNTGSETNEVIPETELVYGENDDENVDENENDESGATTIVPDTSLLSGIDVNEMLTMRLSEVVDLLGPNHSEPYFQQGSTSIDYPGSCSIAYIGGIEQDKEAQIEPDAEVCVVVVYQIKDVYKGISVGKTLDEINSNPEILNAFELFTVGSVDKNGDLIPATMGVYENNGIFIEMYLTFDKDMVCIEVFLKRVESPSEDLQNRMI